LLRKDLIRPTASSLPGEDAYRFRHLLIRDATYDAMPKLLRADLHERYASWLEASTESGSAEHEEVVGFHLERAVRYRIALGMDVDPALGRRAARLFGAAGRRASFRADFAAASALLERAAALLPVDDPERGRLMEDQAAALSRVGETRRAELICDDVIE